MRKRSRLAQTRFYKRNEKKTRMFSKNIVYNKSKQMPVIPCNDVIACLSSIAHILTEKAQVELCKWNFDPRDALKDLGTPLIITLIFN